METGNDFLQSQVDDAVVLHRAFVDALRDHGDDADDPRFSELGARFMPIMEELQRLLEEFQQSLGAGTRVSWPTSRARTTIDASYATLPCRAWQRIP